MGENRGQSIDILEDKFGRIQTKGATEIELTGPEQFVALVIFFVGKLKCLTSSLRSYIFDGGSGKIAPFCVKQVNVGCDLLWGTFLVERGCPRC